MKTMKTCRSQTLARRVERYSVSSTATATPSTVNRRRKFSLPLYRKKKTIFHVYLPSEHREALYLHNCYYDCKHIAQGEKKSNLFNDEVGFRLDVVNILVFYET